MEKTKLRRANFWNDLDVIADLIEKCFFKTLDDDGKRYVQYMRYLGKNKFAREMVLAGGKPEEMLDGFVWQEENEIVGNITISRAKRNGRIVHVISNVAVLNQWLGKGIASALTAAALELAKAEDVAEIWLQVRADNPVAYHLYDQHGFIPRATRSTWIIGKGFLPSQNKKQAREFQLIRTVKEQLWSEAVNLLNANYDSLVDWFFRFFPEQLKPDLKSTMREFFTGSPLNRIGILDRQILCAVMLFNPKKSYGENAWFGSDEYCADDSITIFTKFLFHRNIHPRIQMNLPTGKYQNTLNRNGFIEAHRLIWMSKELLN